MKVILKKITHNRWKIELDCTPASVGEIEEILVVPNYPSDKRYSKVLKESTTATLTPRFYAYPHNNGGAECNTLGEAIVYCMEKFLNKWPDLREGGVK